MPTNNFLFPASGPATSSFNSVHPTSNFLATLGMNYGGASRFEEFSSRRITLHRSLLVLCFTALCAEAPAQQISKALWSIASVSSQETVGSQTPASAAIDGNPSSYWHSQWLAASPPPPHEITVNLGAMYSVSQIQYVPRQDIGNGRIKNYQLYLSQNGTAWGQPVAEGAFPNSTARQLVNIPPTPGRYLRIRSLSSINGDSWAAIAELDLLGVPVTVVTNNPPDSIIDFLPEHLTISPGSMLDFRGYGMDVDSDVPFTFVWDFGRGSGIAPSFSENPGPVRFFIPGQFKVSMAVTDAKGLVDATPDVMKVSVTSDLLDSSRWSLRSASSEETVAQDGAASNAFDRDPKTFWLSHGPANGGPPPHELQIDLGSRYRISGLQYIARQSSTAGRVLAYHFFVSDDGVTWGDPSVSGTFSNTTSEQIVGFAPVFGRYISFIATSSVGEAGVAAVAEIGLFGKLFTSDMGSSSEVFSGNIIDATGAGRVLLTAPDASAQRNALGLGGFGVKTLYESATEVVSRENAELGTSNLVALWTPERVGQAIAALAPTGARADCEQTFVLTIENIENGMNYGIGRIAGQGLPGGFKIDEITAVHVGDNLATPRVDVSIFHGTARNSGTSVLPGVLSVTSTTSGTSASMLEQLAPIPTGSWIWIKTSGRSGVTDNLEISISGKHVHE